MDSKKEVLGASLLAISLVVGLGTVSYGLFSDASPTNAQIEVLSKKNGVPSDSFLPSDIVLLEAHLLYKNALIAGIPVTFEVRTPNGAEFLVTTATTNSLARANITFNIPWPSDLSLGTWHVSARSELYGQSLKVERDFECNLMPLMVDVFTQKGGVGPNTLGGYFVLNETVILSAAVRNGLNQTMPNQLIGFAIKDPNGTAFAYFTQDTTSSGIASITIRIPPVAAYLGTFEVYARTVYNDIVLIDTLTLLAKQN